MEDLEYISILDLLKVLADQTRLELVRILNEGEQTVGDLSRLVELGAPTVSHHLTRLRAAGLVSLRMAGNQRFYRMNITGLDRFKKLAAKIEQMPPAPEPVDDTWIDALGWSAEDQTVLRKYTSGGKITSLPPIPAKKQELTVLFRWLATLFRPDKLYNERKVNEILKAVYAEDYVSLRRDLVDLGYLRRERGGRKYWLGTDRPLEIDVERYEE
jgi:DNA-binding transcriptional ArsR family regulator